MNYIDFLKKVKKNMNSCEKNEFSTNRCFPEVQKMNEKDVIL